MNVRIPTLVAALALAAPGPASATLLVDIVGNLGDGFTTWTLSGTSTAFGDGTIRTFTGASFSPNDTWEASDDGDFLNDGGISDDVFAITGAASITIGGDTESITHIFLDDDGASFNDMGIRTASTLDYLAGEATSWTGFFTVALDISSFNVGSFPSAGAGGTGGFTGPDFSGESDVVISVARTAVPEPTTLGALGMGLLALGARAARRRRR